MVAERLPSRNRSVPAEDAFASSPVQVLERLQRRVEKRMESLQRMRVDGFEPVIAELKVGLDYLRRAVR